MDIYVYMYMYIYIYICIYIYIYIYTCIHRHRQTDNSPACRCGAPRARAAAGRVWRVACELTHPPPFVFSQLGRRGSSREAGAAPSVGYAPSCAGRRGSAKGGIHFTNDMYKEERHFRGQVGQNCLPGLTLPHPPQQPAAPPRTPSPNLRMKRKRMYRLEVGSKTKLASKA